LLYSRRVADKSYSDVISATKSDGLLRKTNRKEEETPHTNSRQRRDKNKNKACASTRLTSESSNISSTSSDETKRSQQQRPLPIRSAHIDPSEFSKAASTLVDKQKSTRNNSHHHQQQQQQLNHCRFCEKNGEKEAIFSSHPLKDSLGKVVCPVLRSHKCPKCKESGDYAHTIKYCPETQRKQKESKIAQCVNDIKQQ
jgi:hypothetical protein